MERWELEQMWWMPIGRIARHVLHLMDEQDKLEKELKVAQLEYGLLEDKIHCAKEAIKFMEEKE